MTRCRVLIPPIRSAPIGRRSRFPARWTPASAGCGSPRPAGISAPGRRRRRWRRWMQSRPRWVHRDGDDAGGSAGPQRGLYDHHDRGCGAASGSAAHPAGRFRCGCARPADRRRAGAGRAVVQAQKFRRWYREAVLQLFEHVDAILAPATPCVAPLIGQKTFVLDGEEMPLRPNIGIYTQPISFIGLPVVAVPVPTAAGLADRRADHHGAVARGRCAAHRPGAGGRRRRAGAGA